ncbi:capreomycidine synthase [Actinomadura nitritigenes]|uniref:capreomycidine synthase n=1 Tax=Actinomadura nitritigenes TaxID=134602 RepID=UPI003D937AA7
MDKGTGRAVKMRLPRAPLEDWLRDYYFTTSADISCSGTEAFSFSELRELLGIEVSDLDSVVFRDSASYGMPALRAAIAQRWGDGDARRVMATNGSSEALFLVMMALLTPGDEIVAVEPAYHSLVSIADGIGCRIVPWSLEFERGFEPDLDRLRSLLSPATRMLVVNFPHNPTGTTVDADTQRAIIELAESHGCYVVWDSVFAELTYDAPPLPDASLLGEQVITFGSLSKSYGLPGLRVGWCFGPPEVLAQCMILRDYTTLALSPLIELVALRAIEGGDRLLHPRITQARRNLDLLSEWVLQNEGRVEWVRPRGGVTAFPRFPDVTDMNAFCHRLMDEHGTLLVPGTCFNRPEHVRLGFGGPTEELQRGLSAVSQLLASIRPAYQARP